MNLYVVAVERNDGTHEVLRCGFGGEIVPERPPEVVTTPDGSLYVEETPPAERYSTEGVA